MEDLTPLYNKEFYLAHLCGEDVVLPIPDGNAEHYLAYLCGMDVTIPDVPDGNNEHYLAYKCGQDVELPDPMYRIEYYLAKWCGIDCEVPEPMYRIEYWLAQLANSGELKTVSGNPISVSDALARPAESLTIEILPQQDLHGYANPWPACGGVNIFDEEMELGILNNDGTVSDSTSRLVNKNFMSITAETEYCYSWDVPSNSSTARPRGAFYDSNYQFVSYVSDLGETPTTVNGRLVSTFTTPASSAYMKFCMYTSYGTTYKNDITFNISNASYNGKYYPYSNICPITGFTGVNIYHESAYDPDADPTYSIDWTDEAGTVYGGTLDVTNGVLTVDRAMVEYDGSDDELWSLGLYSNFRIRNANAKIVPQTEQCVVACNWLKCIPFADRGSTLVPFITSDPNDGYFEIRKYTAVSTVDELKTALASNPIQLVYELSTPLTIQLSPTEIEMLLGNNVIWNDVGDMVLEYLADGPADDIDALQILLNNRYVNNGEPDEATDKEALEILLGGNTR